MLNGGHIAGWAVEDPALLAQIDSALNVLAARRPLMPGIPRQRAARP